MSQSDAMESLPQGDKLRRFFLLYSAPPSCLSSSDSGGRTLWTQEVDMMKLLMECPHMSEQLFLSPMSSIEYLRSECSALCQQSGNCVPPSSLSIRLTHFPPIHAPIPTLPPAGGTLVHLCGTIVRMSTKRVVPFLYRLMCPSCRQVVETYTSPYDRSSVGKKYCESEKCKREELKLVDQIWMDYAECRLQQRSSVSGELPRSIFVTLDDELSVKCSVGQFVEVIGVLFQKWKHVFPSSRPVIEPTVWAVNVQPMEAYRGVEASQSSPAASAFSPESFFSSFKQCKLKRTVALARSACPQLSGLFAPRLSMLLATLGGAQSGSVDSLRVRSTIHCLLVGDPSTGKSQLLRYASQIAPRSTCTTGMGSTSAGLTVAATKERGEWVLEPGALVLSDGGSCIIDELRTVAVADRASLHEAMEQQTISVAKGGLVTKLRTNCAVIAACNPPHQKGKAGNAVVSVGVGGPLLSRFDLIFLLWDTPQAALDERIADHILWCSGGCRDASCSANAPPPLLLASEMSRYLAWTRAQYASHGGPPLSEDAASLLGKYFNILRARGASPSLDDSIPVTIRMLESLVRITQAYAKLHLQPICAVDDAAMAIFLMERSAHGLKCSLGDDLFSSSRWLDDVFLSDSAEDLREQERILRTLTAIIINYASGHFDEAETTNRSDAAPSEEICDENILTCRRRGLRTVPSGCAAMGGTQSTASLSNSQITQCIRLLDEEVRHSFSTPRSYSRFVDDSADVTCGGLSLRCSLEEPQPCRVLVHSSSEEEPQARRVELQGDSGSLSVTSQCHVVASADCHATDSSAQGEDKPQNTGRSRAKTRSAFEVMDKLKFRF